MQGAKDSLCPLDLLEGVRKKMTAVSSLHVIAGGDHSLIVYKTELKAQGRSQPEVDAEIGEAVSTFLRSLGK